MTTADFLFVCLFVKALIYANRLKKNGTVDLSVNKLIILSASTQKY